MDIILAGGTGYLGSHVAEQLVVAGHNVNFLVRRGSNLSFLQSLEAKGEQQLSITVIDFDNSEEIKSRIRAGVTVINCIAETRMHLSDGDRRKVEVETAGRLFTAAQEVKAKRFIQLSTVMAYGFNRPPTAVDETYPCSPEYSYGRIALEREQNLLELHKKGDMELIILRPSNTLGERDSSALPSLLASLKKGKFPVIGGGDWNFSCMDARDVGRAMVHLLRVDVQGPEIFLVKGFDTTWLQLKEALDKKLGQPSTVMNVPKKMALFLGGLLEWLTPYGKTPALTPFSASVVSSHTLFDDSKIRQTGFQPKYDLADSIAHVN